MPTGPYPPDRARSIPAVAQRQAGLTRIRRLTKGMAAAAAGAVVVATGYVAHARPGHHASAATTLQPTTPPTTPPTTLEPSGVGDDSGAPSSAGGDDGSSVGGSAAVPAPAPLAPPTTAPRPATRPQVVSGSS